MNSQQMMEEINRLARLCEAKDAEIAGWVDTQSATHNLYELSQEQLSEAQAQIAMQSEALRTSWHRLTAEEQGPIDNALSATSETVAAWRAKETEKNCIAYYEAGYSKCAEDNFVGAEDAAQIYANGRAAGAKETEPLRREVAMLRRGYCKIIDDTFGFSEHTKYPIALAREMSESSEATALAYEREVENRGAVKALEDAKIWVVDEHAKGVLQGRINELRLANKRRS